MTARLNDVTETLLQFWDTNWVIDDDPRTPFIFGNEATDLEGGAVAWVRVWIRSLPSRQETLGAPGNRKFDRPCLLVADIRTPPGSGQGPGQALGEDVRDLFEAKRLSPYDIRFDQVDIQDIGEIEDGRWYSTLAEAAFRFEDVR